MIKEVLSCLAVKKENDTRSIRINGKRDCVRIAIKRKVVKLVQGLRARYILALFSSS